ncbi:hypothetical protein DRF60_03010 [Chryseobacterium elymi]|uniref:Lipoprotein n=1 Tax=Chryseobacterium elymi TaxID=395936 RepID=A0A3D9DPN3_9FLAO|nr:hypothetical protein [Chryseobacterium elymi]REC79968.1 hypothetical protein DRF60_03010 [Chryseobacterium elymi]
MKTISYILIILIFSSGCSAQHYKLIEAVHTTNPGGVKGSRSENFNIKVKDISKLEPQYLLAGNVKIPLKKENRNGVLHLQGIYFPESPDQITIDVNGTIKKPEQDHIFDINTMYLVSENKKNKKQIKQKIDFSHKNNENRDKILPDIEDPQQ